MLRVLEDFLCTSDLFVIPVPDVVSIPFIQISVNFDVTYFSAMFVIKGTLLSIYVVLGILLNYMDRNIIEIIS